MFLAEITGREFIDNLVSILKQPALNLDVKNRILFHVQNWAIGLEGKATMGYLGTVYNSLQREGNFFQFLRVGCEGILLTILFLKTT